ncbi:hypothetical protein J4450_01040 [Candidatus Micrarchaeota archaeon]|nr:hypothetical protein [Candidatus Micrarchaeota archaeon]
MVGERARVLGFDPARSTRLGGPHNRPCFNRPDPDAEGPRGGGSPPALITAVKSLPNLGFMEAPFVALAGVIEGFLAGRATPDDVKAAVSEAIGTLRTELTRALQTTSDSASQRMTAVEEKVGAAEQVAATARTTADGKVDQKAVDAACSALETRLTEALAGKATPDDVKAAVSEAVGILRTELTRALQTTSDSAAKRMEALEGRVGEAETAAGSAASAASEAQSTADGRATPAQVAEAVQEAVRPLAARVEALEAANTELKAALDERPTKKDVLAAVKKVVQGALRTAAKLVGVEDEAEPEPK